MRQQSKRRTTPAVLRSILEIKDTEMAALLGCSVNTIWSVESGRLALSESLAVRMAHETGISLAWLLKGDPKAAPITNGGRPFDRKHFELHAAGRKYFDKVTPNDFSMKFLFFAGRLRAVLDVANKANTYHMAAYKAVRAIDALAKEFGAEGAFDPATAVAAIQRDIDECREAQKVKKREAAPAAKAGRK